MLKNIKLLAFLIFSVLVLGGCGGKVGFVPQKGDLVFVVAGDSDFSGAISEATDGCDSLSVDGVNVSYVHVGIVDVESDGAVFVVEANDQRGVCLTPWEEFLESAPRIGGRPGVTVMRVRDGVASAEDGTQEGSGAAGTAHFNAGECVERAKSFIGQPYDWYYLPDNGRMYCSELVWEAFRLEGGSRIFTAAPMNFRAPDGSMPEFWTSLFDTLGVPVPEGVPGTNPNAMASDPALAVVYCFF